MARIARNFAAVQRSLPDDSNWPVKIRGAVTDKIAAFADWAEKADGFKIW
jgi:hypothetical protein